MAIDFPASPSNGQTFTDGSTTWTWDGTKWSITSGAAGATDKIEEGNTSAEVIDTGSDGRFVVTTEGSERLRVDKSGRLLVGTSSALSGSVNGNFNSSNALLQVVGNSSGTPRGATFALGRSQPASAINVDDFIGGLIFSDNASAEFAHIFCYADAAAGTGDHPSRLVFSTTADGASTPTERMRIGQDGRTTITGSTTGSSNFTLTTKNSAGTTTFEVRNDGLFNTGTAATSPYNFTSANAANFVVVSDGNCLRSTSSLKYKTNVEDLQDQYADAILNCRPVWYQSLSAADNPDWGHWGLIAEEVAVIDPRLCFFGKNEDGTLEPDGVQYDRFVPHLLNLIKRQQQAIETLEAANTDLAARLTKLEGGTN